MQDLDEYLIPHAHDNLTALLDELNKPNLASFSFQNAFFYLYWPDDTAASAPASAPPPAPPQLVTLHKTRRLARLHRHGSRSKYIVKPENVVECGNHNIWLYRLGKRQLKVNETLGLSHHYRQTAGYSPTFKYITGYSLTTQRSSKYRRYLID